MKANNLTDQRNNPTKPKRPDTTAPKIDDLKHIPLIPTSDQELKDIVQRAFPTPTVSPGLTASILDKIKNMNPE